MAGRISNLSGAFVSILDKILWYYRVRLHGQSAEQTSLDPSWRAFGHVHGPKTERAKWEAHLTDHAVEHHEIADADDGNG